MADKVDPKKELASYRARKGRFEIVDVPERSYLMVDAHGDPNGPAFAPAVEALYPVAYTTKFASKRELGRDYVVPPLEGLWWADDLDAFTARRDKDAWSWTLMILVPDWVPGDLVDEAVERVRSQEPPQRLDDVRLERLDEGRCVQTLHVGSYDDEAPVLRALHEEFLPEHGLTPSGKHHEIYLSDRRRVAPARLRTVLRQPVDPR